MGFVKNMNLLMLSINDISWLDLVILGFAALGLIFGLFGKAKKKIFNLVVILISILTAFFTCQLVLDTIKGLDSGVLSAIGGASGMSVGDFISNKLSEALSSFNVPAEKLVAIIDGLLLIIMFWLEFIVFRIVLGFIGVIIKAIVFRKKEGVKERRFALLSALFGAVNWAAFAVMLLIPVFALAPVLKGVSGLIGDNPTVAKVQEQVEKSKSIEIMDKLFSNEKIATKLTFLSYTDAEGNKKSFYKDLNGLGSATKLAAKFTQIMGGDGEGGEEVNPIAVLSELTDDEIREALGSEVIQDVVGPILTEALGIDGDIDLAKEADMLIAVKDIVSFDDDGEMTFDVDNIDTEKLAGALAQSEIALTLAESAEGMLADIPEATLTGITDELEALKGSGDLSAEDYDTLMKLFTKSEE